MKKVLPVLVAILFFGWLIQSNINNKAKIEKAGLEDLNLKLTGIVDTVLEGNNYHGFGIIRLKIVSTNIKEYDPRLKQRFYFCIIKNGIAEIYDHTFGTQKGDTLLYDTKAKLGSVLRNGKKAEEGSITINTDEDYCNFIRRKTIFK